MTFLRQVTTLMESDDDPDVLQGAAVGIAECRESSGPGALGAAEVPLFVRKIFVFMGQSLARSAKLAADQHRQQAALAADPHDEEDEEKDVEEDEDLSRRACTVAFSALMKTNPVDFAACLPEVAVRTWALLATGRHKAMALHLGCNLVEHLGEDRSRPGRRSCLRSSGSSTGRTSTRGSPRPTPGTWPPRFPASTRQRRRPSGSSRGSSADLLRRRRTTSRRLERPKLRSPSPGGVRLGLPSGEGRTLGEFGAELLTAVLNSKTPHAAKLKLILLAPQLAKRGAAPFPLSKLSPAEEDFAWKGTVSQSPEVRSELRCRHQRLRGASCVIAPLRCSRKGARRIRRQP